MGEGSADRSPTKITIQNVPFRPFAIKANSTAIHRDLSCLKLRDHTTATVRRRPAANLSALS